MCGCKAVSEGPVNAAVVRGVVVEVGTAACSSETARGCVVHMCGCKAVSKGHVNAAVVRGVVVE
eukprot:1145008-Pelagomonas_calceolata.AAC.1